MQTIRSVKANKVTHWCRYEFAPTWHSHVRIGVGHDGVATGIDGPAVDIRQMIPLLLDHVAKLDGFKPSSMQRRDVAPF